MPNEKKMWQVPAYGGNPDTILTWLNQQVLDGFNYNQSSPGYEQLEESIRILSGQPSTSLVIKQRDERYSRLHTSRLKRNLREMVNALADIRFTPGYRSDNNDYQDLATTLNRVAASWYSDRFIDVQIKKAIQWMAITPCCYMELQYRRLPGERDKCEIDLIPHSYFDVVTTGVPQSQDLQECYTVTIVRDLPVYLSHAMWPKYAEFLEPDRETPLGWRDRVLAVMKDIFTNAPELSTARNPTIRMYYMYVLDLSINKSGKTRTMGLDPETDQPTSWTYEVPSLGADIPAGYDENGTQVYRKATAKDARLFPGRRLLVATANKLIYDGPNWDWHGKVPLVKMSSDSWPFADYSMVHDNANVQEATNELERMMHQTARNKMNPSMMYNSRAVARDEAKGLRTEVTGQRIGWNGNETNDPLKPLLPATFYEVEQWQPDLVKYLGDSMDYTMGVRDMAALAKMKMGGNADSMEKIAEMAGPIVKGISRDMERAFRDVAEMFKFLVFQYYNTPKIMQIVGPDGVTPQNFDFDPGKLVPSHLPGENVKYPSLHSTMERARWIADHVTFFITPNTLHQITQTAQKMMYMQLWRGGFPIDPWTIAEIFNIGDFGKKPEGTNDILSRWLAWQKEQMAIKAEMQEDAETLGGAIGQGGQPGTGPNGGQLGVGGRAPTGQTAPHISPANSGRGQRVRETH